MEKKEKIYGKKVILLICDWYFIFNSTSKELFGYKPLKFSNVQSERKNFLELENSLLKSDFFGSVQKALNPLLKNQ